MRLSEFLFSYKIFLKFFLIEKKYFKAVSKFFGYPYKYLVEIIKGRKWDKSSIGLEMDSHYFTAFCYETIKNGLPNAKFKDVERLVNWVRIVKSD